MDTLIHRWFEEVWNQGRESLIDELTTEDAVAVSTVGTAISLAIWVAGEAFPLPQIAALIGRILTLPPACS